MFCGPVAQSVGLWLRSQGVVRLDNFMAHISFGNVCTLCNLCLQYNEKEGPTLSVTKKKSGMISPNMI